MSILNSIVAPRRVAADFLQRQRPWSVAVAVACAASCSLTTPAMGESLGQHVLTSTRLVQPANDEDTRLGGASIFGGEERLPSYSPTHRLALPPIGAATTQMTEIGNGSMPESFTGDQAAEREALPEQIEQRDPNWAWSTYCFSAPNTFSNPLYFEDVMLERHGHERFPAVQPLVSGARFFATVPMLPYLMTVRPACECEYKMGHFRAGDCVHPYLQRPPYERKAVVVQGLATAGVAVGLP